MADSRLGASHLVGYQLIYDSAHGIIVKYIYIYGDDFFSILSILKPNLLNHSF